MAQPLMVIVHRVTSISDPETGRLGKQIDLVETRLRGSPAFLQGVGEDEAKLVRGILTQFQSMGVLPPIGQITLPKITLYLTDSEYEQLGLNLEVNDKLEVSIDRGIISLKKTIEGL